MINTLQIVENFKSIQGEGPFVGQPSIFFRFMKCPLTCSFCFPGRTNVFVPREKITTPRCKRTKKKIEDIKPGDKVYTYDLRNKRLEVKKVIRKYETDTDEVLRIQTNKREILYCTIDHPFYIKDEGWVIAKDLKPGQEFITFEQIHSGKISKYVKSTEIINKSTIIKSFERLAGRQIKRIKVYDLEVEDNSNYFVEGILAHNCDTKYTWKKEILDPNYIELTDSNSIDEYIENNELLKCGIKNIVITGGEPLISSNKPLIYTFIKNLIDRGFDVTIETSGFSSVEDDVLHSNISQRLNEVVENVIDNEEKLKNIHFSISPKLTFHSYQNNSNICLVYIIKFYIPNNNISEKIDFYYKFVYHKSMERHIKSLIQKLDNKIKIYCMPLTPNVMDAEKYKKTSLETVEFCLENNINYSPREHINLWDLNRGV